MGFYEKLKYYDFYLNWGWILLVPIFMYFVRVWKKKKDIEKLHHRLTKQVAKRVEREKKSTKYIPEVFIESHGIKEQAREFCLPRLFLSRAVSDFNISYKQGYEHVKYYSKYLGQFIPRMPSSLTVHTIKDSIAFEINDFFSYVKEFLKNEKKNLENYRREISDFIDLEKNDKGDVKNAICQLLASEYDFRDDEKSFKIFRDQLFIYADGAGKGKTNFICDLADRFILSHKIPCILLNGTDFNDQNDFMKVIIKQIYGANTQNEEKLLSNLENLCRNEDSFFIIIIDAINEHNDIKNFSIALNNFIHELCTNYSFIKFILTVRTEHYEQRFQTLDCLENNRHLIKPLPQGIINFEKDRPYVECAYILKKYLSFFSLENIFYFAPNIVNALGNNFLLLRIFCEVHRGSSYHIRKGYQTSIYNLNLDILFSKFISLKFSSISSRLEGQTRSIIDSELRITVDNIIKLIIDNSYFQNISVEALLRSPDISSRYVESLLLEDVFIRKDIHGDSEVYNFAYDELRDFLIVEYCVRNKLHDFLIESSCNESIAICEGIRKYLFFRSRVEHSNFWKQIKECYWYESVEFENIFSLEENSITDNDIRIIKKLFYEGENTLLICIRLLERSNCNHFYQLNADKLFSWIKSEKTIVNEITDQLTYFKHEEPWDIRWFKDGLNSMLDLSTNMGKYKIYKFMLHICGAMEQVKKELYRYLRNSYWVCDQLLYDCEHDKALIMKAYNDCLSNNELSNAQKTIIEKHLIDKI